MAARSPAEIFIRADKKSEYGRDHGRFISPLPDKAGYEKVYKPYGSKGRGYYYIRKAKKR